MKLSPLKIIEDGWYFNDFCIQLITLLMLIHLDWYSNRIQKRIQVAWRAFDMKKGSEYMSDDMRGSAHQPYRNSQ